MIFIGFLYGSNRNIVFYADFKLKLEDLDLEELNGSELLLIFAEMSLCKNTHTFYVHNFVGVT